MYGDQLGMHQYMNAQSMYPRMPLPSEMVEETPTYVNAKQYRRIIKRRQARALLEKRKTIPTQRRNYLHESRHAHACRRPRGPGGRFLTKMELDAYKKLEAGGMPEKEAVAQAVAISEKAKLDAAAAAEANPAPEMAMAIAPPMEQDMAPMQPAPEAMQGAPLSVSGLTVPTLQSSV